RSGKIPVIAPVDFMDYTVSENVYAGNAMNRRLFYQYGLLLPASPHGYVAQGLGPAVSAGAMGLMAPTRHVEKDIEEFEVDGVRMVFQNTPNTEAPREMNTYIPEMKALWMAENVIASLHNIYTLRGAPVRDPLNWSKYISQALHRLGVEAEVMFASHHWPRWGNDRVQEVLRAQRDLYAHMNNQVLHLANQGVTINEIHNVYEVPRGLQSKWFCRGYHGSPEHNSRGVIQRYLGFWETMMGAKTLEAQIADGTAKVEGDAGILKQLASTMVDFDPRFEIMIGTKARGTEVVKADPYEAVPRQTIAE
ncbi:MAG: alkyl sulfatase dimerization domain-containing protein, partial [Terrimicrobiaceae bacterium]